MTEILIEVLACRKLEAKAEAAALERGWLAIKSDDSGGGGYQLVDLLTRRIVSGQKFDLTPSDVLAVCRANPRLNNL